MLTPGFSTTASFLLLALMQMLGCTSCGQSGAVLPVAIQPNTLKHSGFVTKGISLVAPVRAIDSTAFTTLKKTNANSVAIMPYAFCTKVDGEVHYNNGRQWWGETSEGVKETIRLAHTQSLSVMLKPHLWLQRGGYTGDLDFETEAQWQTFEASFADYTLHFAKLADSAGADIFCFATELRNPIKKRPAFFKKLIDDVKLVFHGKLTYAANWDDYEDVPFWNEMTFIGIDAYFPLSDENSPTVEQLMQGWQKYLPALQKFSAKKQLKIAFTEYGYRNSDAAAKEPWAENNQTRNDQAQANALEAFYTSFAHKDWFLGGYLWKWYIRQNAQWSVERGERLDFTPQDKIAETVVTQWYGTGN